MKTSQIKIVDSEPRLGTVMIAEGFGRKHDQIKHMIRKYSKEFEEISGLKTDISKAKTKPIEEYLLNEYQFMFLGTLLRNTPKVLRFKLNVTKAFSRITKALLRSLNQKGNPKWDQARLTGKTVRSFETKEIQKFIAYAKTQGGSAAGCDLYYSNLTRMMNDLLFICEGKFKSLRDLLTPEQLVVVASAERIIRKTLRDGMKKDVFYKEIYQKAKANMIQFAEMSGQSEVISRTLLLKDEPPLLT